MKVRSRAFKAVILAAGTGFTKLAGILSAVVLARYLTTTDYSTYRQALLAYGTVAPFMALGLPKALYYFLPGEDKRAGGILLENFIPLCVMGLAFMVGLWCGGADLLAMRFNNPGLAAVLVIFAPYALFMLPQNAFTACMMARDRVQHVAIFKPVSKLVMVGAVVAIALMLGNSEGAIIGAVVGAGLIGLPTVWLMFHVCRGGSWNFSFKGIRKQIFYGVPLGLAAMVGTTAGNIDKLLVSSMGTPEQFAVYVNGAMQLPLVGIVTGSVIAVLLPDMAKYYKAGRKDEAIEIWKRAAVKCGLVLIPAGIFLAVMGSDLMAFLFSERYRDSGIPFTFYALIIPLNSFSFATPLLAAGRTKVTLVESLVYLVLNTGLSFLAIKLIGVNGAAFATLVIAYLWGVSFNSLMIKRVYGVKLTNFIPRELYKVVFATVLASVSFLLLIVPVEITWVRLIMCAFSFGIILALIYNRMGLISVSELYRRCSNVVKRRNVV